MTVDRHRTTDIESIRLLLVDDHEDSCDLFRLVLEERGHVVEVATDGVEALAKLVTGRFEVAVLDLGLPNLDGFEVARRVQEQLAAAAPLLIAMTGYATGDFRERTQRAGFKLHLVKPVSIEALIAAVESVGRF
jgi:CheY-like chemotaxis protein